MLVGKKMLEHKENLKCNASGKDEMLVVKLFFFIYSFFWVANCWYDEVVDEIFATFLPSPLSPPSHFSMKRSNFYQIFKFCILAWKELITWICMGSFYFHFSCVLYFYLLREFFLISSRWSCLSGNLCMWTLI